MDTLKIDQTFIQDTAKTSKSIVASVISLATKLQMNLVAEGVEDYEQLKFLYDEKCGEMQGYLFSKPVSQTIIEDYLKSDKTLQDRIETLK